MLSKDGQHLLPSTLGTWEEILGFEVLPLVTLCTQQQFIYLFFNFKISHPSSSMQCTMKTKELKGRQQLGFFNFFICVCVCVQA
jgi:hypothetical protein